MWISGLRGISAAISGTKASLRPRFDMRGNDLARMRHMLDAAREAPHEANLFDIHAKYADVVSVEEAISCLGRVGANVR